MTLQDPSENGRERRVQVTHGQHGWEVKVLRNDEVVRRMNYTDWHRVERAVDLESRSRERRDESKT